VSGIACHVISTRLPTGRTRKLCVEKDTLLIRSVRTDLGSTLINEQRQNIRVNQPLDPRLFASD
jgi:hypothetical protein